jgi:hypothetical protein
VFSASGLGNRNEYKRGNLPVRSEKGQTNGTKRIVRRGMKWKMMNTMNKGKDLKEKENN